MYNTKVYPIIKKVAISSGIYSYEILCPDIAKKARPGQFVHIKIEGFTLRRPISICDIDGEKGTIRMVFEVRGEGTERLSQSREGDNIDMLAPLGNGFNLSHNGHIIVVGGGIGTPPLLPIAKAFGERSTAILGFRSYDKIILDDDFKKTGAKVIICTDDGSVGIKGNVITPLKKEFSETDGNLKIYACGPEIMLKSIVNECEKAGIPNEISLEERMGCGLGACVVCSCRIKSGDNEKMLRVCKDGPVFKGEEVVFNG